jgi:hypothetical protein
MLEGREYESKEGMEEEREKGKKGGRKEEGMKGGREEKEGREKERKGRKKKVKSKRRKTIGLAYSDSLKPSFDVSQVSIDVRYNPLDLISLILLESAPLQLANLDFH